MSHSQSITIATSFPVTTYSISAAWLIKITSSSCRILYLQHPTYYSRCTLFDRPKKLFFNPLFPRTNSFPFLRSVIHRFRHQCPTQMAPLSIRVIFTGIHGPLMIWSILPNIIIVYLSQAQAAHLPSTNKLSSKISCVCVLYDSAGNTSHPIPSASHSYTLMSPFQIVCVCVCVQLAPPTNTFHRLIPPHWRSNLI